MKILLCEEPKNMYYAERSIPVIDPDEVLIKVKAVGICGTDIHAFNGKQPFFSYPRVLGHEISGVIEQVGGKVKNFKTHQRVTVIPAVACGQCVACQTGKPNCCESISLYGVHQDGGFSEYLAVLASNLVVVPDSIAIEDAALIEPFAISAHAVSRANIRENENVLVIGAGAIGIGAAVVAKAAGANVVCADISAYRCDYIHSNCGLVTLNPLDRNFPEQLKMHFNGELPHVVFDATGNKSSMKNTVNLISHGGRIVFIGLFIGDLELDDPTFHKKETTLFSSRNATRSDFDKVISLMESGEINTGMIKNREFNFHTVNSVYQEQIVDSKTLLKGVILFNDLDMGSV